MSENRSQDIQLIKLAVQVEKDGVGFVDRFIEKTSEDSSLRPFLQELKETFQQDEETIESLLSALEASQDTGDIDEISLDDYVKELQKSRSEKFYPQNKIAEHFDGFFNPIRVLGFLAETLKEQVEFYLTGATNIYYDNEKTAFKDMAQRKKDEAEEVSRKKAEIISRFP